jgi:hypothetical protein
MNGENPAHGKNGIVQFRNEMEYVYPRVSFPSLPNALYHRGR